MNRLLASFVFFLCLVASFFVKANEPFTVLIEDAFPLQYLENGQYQGPIAEKVKKLLIASDIEQFNITLLPWARALETAKKKSNTMITGLVRMPARENDYHWIGVVERLDYYFYAKKSFAKAHEITADNIKTFNIGTQINSATDRYLRANGFTNISSTSSFAQNAEKLMNNRVDLFPASITIFQASCKKSFKNCEQFVPVLPINMPSKDLWLAVSKNTPVALVNKLKAQFTQL